MKNAEESVQNHFRLFLGFPSLYSGLHDRYMVQKQVWTPRPRSHGLQAMTTKRLHIKQHAVDKHPA